MIKILFLYNNYEREHTIIKIICNRIKNKNVKIYSVGITDKNLIREIFRIRPYITFTFPITTQNQIYIYEILKVFFHSIIITFTTEGLFDYRNNDVVKTCVGFYDYPSTLIDYHVYWGRLAAKYIGQELFRQNKINGKHQIRIFGNPMYEKIYYKEERIEKLQKDVRDKVLILTGFHGSLYSRQDFINAQDIVNIEGKNKREILQNESVIKWCNTAREEKIYCEKYTQQILNSACENPDILFIIKLHPQEILIKNTHSKKLKYLEKLKNIDNIYIIDKSIPIGTLLPYCKLLVHYGSTADLESYVYRVPTLKLEVTNINNTYMVEASRLTQSTFYADIDDKNAISKYVTELKEKGNLFKESSIVQKQLYDYMNYIDEDSYKPSRKIADFLCGKLKYNKIKLNIKELYEMIDFMIKNYIS